MKSHWFWSVRIQGGKDDPQIKEKGEEMHRFEVPDVLFFRLEPSPIAGKPFIDA